MTVILPSSLANGPSKTNNGGVESSAVNKAIAIAFVNVSAPDLTNTIFLSWQNPCMNGSNSSSACDPAAYDANFNLEVPKGSNRLIQILAVMIDSNFNSGSPGVMNFYYGDQLTNIVNDVESVNIPVALKGGSAGQGNFTGRLIGPSGSPITGKLKQYFKVGADKPPILVGKQDIFAGWVHDLTILKGATFDLVSDIDNSVLATDVSLDNIMTPGNAFSLGNNLMAVNFPSGYRWDSGNTSGQGWARDAHTDLIGFAGKNILATNRICFNNIIKPLPGFFSDATHSIPVSWNGTSTLDPSAAFVLGGGFSSNNSSIDCADPLNSLNYNLQQAANSAGSAVGIQPPFALPANGSTYGSFIVMTNPAAGTVNLEWGFVPQLATGTTPLNGVTVFSYLVPAPQGSNSSTNQDPPFRIHGMNDGYDCQGLSDGTYPGISRLADVDLSKTRFTLPTTLISSLPNNIFVLCPYRDRLLGMSREYFTSAIQTYSGMQPSGPDFGGGNGGGGGFQNQPPAQLTFLDYKNIKTSSIGLYDNECTPIGIQLLDSAGNPTSTQNQMTYSLTATPNINGFFRDPSCSPASAISSPLTTYGSSFGGTQIFIKTSPVVNMVGSITAPIAAAADSITVTASSPILSLSNTATATINISQRPAGYPDMLSIIGPSSIHAYDCVALTMIKGIQATGLPLNGFQFVNINFASPPSGLEFFAGSDYTCSQPLAGPINYNLDPNSTNFNNFFIRYSGTSSTLTISPTTSLTYNNPIKFSVLQPGPAQKLAVEINPNIPQSSCQQGRVALRDSFYNLTPAPAAGQVSLIDTGGGQFFTTSDCASTGTPNPTFSVPAQSTGFIFYYKNTSVPGITGNISASATGFALTPQPASYTIEIAVANKLMIVLPGQTVSSDSNGAITLIGTPIPLSTGKPTPPIRVIALNPNNTIDTSMNGYKNLTIKTSQNFWSGVLQNQINFGSGIGSFNGTPDPASDFTGQSFYLNISSTNSKGQSIQGNSQSFGLQLGYKIVSYNSGSFYAGNCYPSLVSIEDESGSTIQLTNTTTALNLNFSPYGSSGPFTDANCSLPTTNGMSSLTLSTTSTAAIIYRKPGGTESGTIMSNTPPMFHIGSPWNFNFTTIMTTPSNNTLSPWTYKILGSSNILANRCQAFMASLFDSQGKSALLSSLNMNTTTTSFPDIQLSDSSGGNNFYSDAQCTTVLTGSQLRPGTQSSLLFYYKAPTAQTGTSQTVVLNIGPVTSNANLQSTTKALLVSQ